MKSRDLGLPGGSRKAFGGLILIFNFFDGLGGMAIVTAWWGIWHIVAGLTLATYWKNRPPLNPVAGSAQ